MTATVSHAVPARFQLADANTWAEPWAMYRALRDHDPVHRVIPDSKPDHDYYVMSRHADIWAAARDHETFSSAQGLTVNYGELELIGLQDNPPMLLGRHMYEDLRAGFEDPGSFSSGLRDGRRARASSFRPGFRGRHPDGRTERHP